METSLPASGLGWALKHQVTNQAGAIVQSNAGLAIFYEAAGATYLTGKGALVRIYNRALSQLEREDHYAQERRLFGV